MTTTREQFTACIIFIITGLLCTSHSNGQVDPKSIVGVWLFDEASGNIARDNSRHGYDADLKENPAWVEGKFGHALEFQGGSYLEIRNSSENLPFGGTEPFSITAWVRNQGGGTVIGKFNGGIIGAYILVISGDGTVTFHREVAPWTFSGIKALPDNDFGHVAVTYDGAEMKIYVNGEFDARQDRGPQNTDTVTPVLIGARFTNNAPSEFFNGVLDEVALFNVALTEEQIRDVMGGLGLTFLRAFNPNPEDGAFHEDTWVSLSWSPGDFAVSHDVYLGDNPDDVKEATRDSELFRGNQDLTFYTAGFPGNPYPDGLVNGTTYYWRIDEVNEAEPNSPWKGDVWSFLIPPKTAYEPNPSDGAELVNLSARLTWTAGFGAILSTVYFGEDFDTVNNASGGLMQSNTTYNPGPLKLAKTYYWRVDAFDGAVTHKGEIWSFTTEGAVTGPNPANGAVDIKPSVVLGWIAGAVAESHEVYFGSDADAVKNATKASPEYKGPKALGEETYDPGKLTLNTSYFWRIDEVNSINPDSPWAGNVWRFTTSNFIVIDDFEDYDASENQIWFSWHDGLGAGTPGSPGYLPGNGTGSAVGDETTPSYTEESIVHGGNQSMPIAYDNDKQGYSKYSEVELTLSAVRDWTAEGVMELSLWFRGYPASVGSFVEGPVGTYTITSRSGDIWNQADEFHYAYKMLTGVGSIIARVESVENTAGWAKCGVMIRETLNPGSKFAAVYVMPTNADGTPTNGVRFQARTDTNINATSDTSVATAEQMAIVAPYWIKLERDVAGNFRGYYSSNGVSWTPMAWNPQSISMTGNVYVGLALASNNTNAVCKANISNVTITGTVGTQWTNQDIGIASNDAEPLYVAVSNSAGAPAVVVHDDPAAATIDSWTEWVILLQAFADQGIVLTDVDRIAIGLGTQGNMTVPGGSGKMYIDDIRLYQPGEAAE
jgi:hypothetical protein